MIKIQEVSFRYDDEQDENKYALKNISLEVKSGEFVCIIGQNGSGKSTLSKLINAIYPPTSGKVFVGGLDTADPAELWNIRKTAGMVFQNPDNQMVATIVEEDVAFGAENLGVTPAEIRARVDRALKTVGMYDYRFKSPENLSGGQKQRVAIAGILAMEPRCFVFDESTAMLDPSGRREVLDVIDTLHEAGMTVILVTHHMDEAVRADRVFVMDGGSIVMQGAPKEIFAQPDELRRLRLDIPFAVYASLTLRKRGLEMGICLTPEELTGEILKLASFDALHPERTGEGAARAGNVGADAGDCAELLAPGSDHGDSRPGGNEAEDSLWPKRLQEKDPEFGAADTAADAVHTAGLSHVYDEGTAAAFAAIRDIDLRIGRGELVGIIGHTGSGKSTFIQHINGLLSPTSGRIVVAGLDITKASADNGAEKKVGRKKRKKPTRKELAATQKRVLEIRKKVGLVFQYPEYQLFEETVEKDIMFGPLNLGVSDAAARLRAKESMEIVGLDYDAFAGRSPFDLSGGQKRRAAIAGVLAMQPEVLILDEPTAGLDPQGRDELLDEIRNLHELKNTTILVVSHSMDDMARFAQRILVMSKGQLVLDDAPRKVFAEYELLRSVGLDVPEVCKTLRLLRRSGLCVDPTIVDPKEGIDAIERGVRAAAESFPAEDAASGVPTAQIAGGEARGADPELKSAPESTARDLSDSESTARDLSDSESTARDLSDSEGGEQHA